MGKRWFDPDALLPVHTGQTAPLLTMPIASNDPLPSGEFEFRRGPFPTAAGENAPSGLPPYGVVPVVDATPVEPTVEMPVAVPEKTTDEKLAEALKSVGPDVSTVTPRATKAEKEAVAERVKISKDNESLVNVKRDEDTSKARELAEQTARELELERQLAEEAANRKIAAEAELQRRTEELDAKRAEYEQNGTIRDMFGGDAGARVQANLMTGIGAFASARGSGMPNLAGQRIANELKEWQTQEVSRIARDENLFKLAREDRDKALANVEIQVRNRAAAMATVAAKERANILASHGVAEANIAADETINKLRDERAAMLQKNAEGLRSVTTSSNATQQDIKKDIAKAKVDSITGKGLGKPEQGTLDKLGEFNGYLSQTDETLKLMKERPDLVDHVMRARRQWQREESAQKTPYLGKIGAAVGQAIGTVPQTEEDAISGKYSTLSTPSESKTKELSPKDAEIAREIFRGVKNLEIAKGMTFGGVLRDNDVQMAQNISSTIHGTPSELIRSVEKFRENIGQRRKLITENKLINDVDYKRKNADLMERLRRNPQDQAVREELTNLRSAFE